MKKLKKEYHKLLKVGSQVTAVHFGSAKEAGEELEVSGTIDEVTFYYFYCCVTNVVLPKGKQMTPTQMLIMSVLMSKPLEFTLPIDSKDGKLMDLAKEISNDEKERSRNSIYQSVKKMKEAGHLVETDDKIIVPCARLQYVRVAIKKQIALYGCASFDYLFKCYVS